MKFQVVDDSSILGKSDWLEKLQVVGLLFQLRVEFTLRGIRVNTYNEIEQLLNPLETRDS